MFCSGIAFTAGTRTDNTTAWQHVVQLLTELAPEKADIHIQADH